MLLQLDGHLDPVRRLSKPTFFARSVFFEKSMDYDVCVTKVKTQRLPRETLLSPILQIFLTPRFFSEKDKKRNSESNTGVWSCSTITHAYQLRAQVRATYAFEARREGSVVGREGDV